MVICSVLALPARAEVAELNKAIEYCSNPEAVQTTVINDLLQSGWRRTSVDDAEKLAALTAASNISKLIDNFDLGGRRISGKGPDTAQSTYDKNYALGRAFYSKPQPDIDWLGTLTFDTSVYLNVTDSGTLVNCVFLSDHRITLPDTYLVTDPKSSKGKPEHQIVSLSTAYPRVSYSVSRLVIYLLLVDQAKLARFFEHTPKLASELNITRQ
jgi:hypothetical protein